MQRFRKSGTTPEPSTRDRVRFRALITPADRTRGPWLPRKTVGDLLDSPAIECTVRFFWFKEATGYLGVRAKPCGRPVCTTCVVDWLTDNVCPAWASWNGVASYTIVERDPGQHTFRMSGVRTRGPEAISGALSIPAGDSRIIMAPADIGLALQLRGTELDVFLLDAIRAISLEWNDGTSRKPNDDSRIGSTRRPMGDLTDIGARAGFLLAGGQIARSAEGVTIEQFRRWKDDVYGRRSTG